MLIHKTLLYRVKQVEPVVSGCGGQSAEPAAQTHR